MREKTAQDGGDILAATTLEVALQAEVEPGMVEGRLEVKGQRHPLPAIEGVHRLAAQGEYGWPADAEGGEAQFAELLVDPLAVDQQPHRDVAQRQPGHEADRGVGAGQRHQGRPGGHHAVAEGRRHAIAVASRAGAGIGLAAGGEDDPVAVNTLAREPHADDAAFCGEDIFHRAVEAYLRPALPDPVAEHPHHVERATREGEDAAAPLHHQGQAALLEKGGQLRGEKPLEALAQEAAVFAETGEEFR